MGRSRNPDSNHIQRTSANPSRLEFALRAVERGWPVIKLHWAEDGECSCGIQDCPDVGKHPSTINGIKNATKDKNQIRAWWLEKPKANIGIAMGNDSGIFVLDVDPRHGGDGSLQQMQEEYGALPDGPRVRTGGGGEHLYFTVPPGVPVRTRVALRPGIDVRGKGSYAVGVGSVHASGRKYLWQHGKTPSQLPVPVCPDWLLELISEQRPPKPKAKNCIPEGQRNSQLTSLAGTMRRREASAEAIEAALLAENLERCQPPLDESEVLTIAASVSRYSPESAESPLVEDENSTPINLPFRTAAEIEVETPAEVDWVARPWVAAGASTELDGKVKLAGKTTFTLHLVHAVVNGVPFMGQSTRKTAVVYLTEQNATSFREATKSAGLLGREDFVVLYFKDIGSFQWTSVARAAVEECKRRDAKLLVVDTLTQFAGIAGDGENNAGDALAAMRPLQQAAAEGISVLITRHERKSGGTVGDSGRGSSAYGGAVDIVLSLRRPEGNQKRNVRLLQALSRFDETPAEQLIELTDDGYRSLGEPGDVAIETERLNIIAALPNEKKERPRHRSVVRCNRYEPRPASAET
jgi:Bifunctional DNA primase/polymerase, N-terminal/AAA domain/Primase C terminal 1 (PriCT-1)